MKILVVDDDESIRENLEIRLKANKFEVITASDGQRAINLVKEQKPDVVLLDIMMPGMDGFETCERIKKDTASDFVPVLMLTALRRIEDRVKGLKAGADDFISKPFEDEELLARIDAFMRTKKVHDQLNKSLEELKKLEGLRDNLTQLIVHDLRSPVSSIMASIAVFQGKQSSLALQEPIADLLKKTKRNCQIQVELINDILEISRMDNQEIKLEKRPLSIPTLIADGVAEIETSAVQKEITITQQISQELPVLIADEVYVHRVIVNIINNSLKYTERGGTIHISVEYNEKKKEFIFRIEDNGMGIAPENLAKIFDRYFQAEQGGSYSRRGVGLGLAFCQMAVEAHGGTIWVESEQTKGSVFYFTIPETGSQ